MNRNRLFYFPIFLSLVLFSLTRYIKLLTNENYFTTDFGYYYLLTKTIVINHSIPLIGHVVGDVGGFAQGAGWYYLLSIPFYIGNGDPYAAKVLMFVISLITLSLGFFISLKFFSMKETIIILFLLGTSPYLITWTGIVWPPFIIPILILFYLFSFLLLLKKRGKYPLFFMGLSLGAMIHFELASFGLLLPGFVFLIFFLFKKSFIKRKELLQPLIAIAIVFIPHIFHDILNRFTNINGIINLFKIHREVSHPNLNLILADRLSIFRADLLEVFPGGNLKMNLLFLLFISILFFLFLRQKKVEKWKKIFTTYLTVSIPFTFICLCAFPSSKVPYWWSTYLVIFYIFIAGILIPNVIRVKKSFGILIVIFFMIYFGISSIKQFISLHNNYQTLKYNFTPISIIKPIDYIYSNSKNLDFDVIYITGQKKILEYQYIFWYEGTKKFSNSKHFEHMDLAFRQVDGTPYYINEIKQLDKINKKKLTYILVSPSGKNADLLTNLPSLIHGKVVIVSSKIIPTNDGLFTVFKVGPQ